MHNLQVQHIPRANELHIWLLKEDIFCACHHHYICLRSITWGFIIHFRVDYKCCIIFKCNPNQARSWKWTYYKNEMLIQWGLAYSKIKNQSSIAIYHLTIYWWLLNSIPSYPSLTVKNAQLYSLLWTNNIHVSSWLYKYAVTNIITWAFCCTVFWILLSTTGFPDRSNKIVDKKRCTANFPNK